MRIGPSTLIVMSTCAVRVRVSVHFIICVDAAVVIEIDITLP